jgi:hypothetical protein
MNPDLSMILSLKRVLESVGEGMGMAQSLVRELGHSYPLGRDSARLLLLGFPLTFALRPLIEQGSEEVSMLASLIASAPRSGTSLVGKSGEALALTLERWAKARENSKLENKVMRFRSLVTSGVLGAVAAMVASLGPLVGDLNFSGNAGTVDIGTLLAAAACMTAGSSAMLGYFLSGRAFFINVVASMAVFVLVSAIASPLASVQSVALWGVK